MTDWGGIALLLLPTVPSPSSKKSNREKNTNTNANRHKYLQFQFYLVSPVYQCQRVGWSTFNNYFTHKHTNETLQNTNTWKKNRTNTLVLNLPKAEGRLVSEVGERLVAAIGNQFIVRSSSGLSQTQLCCCQVYKTGFKSVASLSLSADPLLFSTLLYCWFSPRVVWWQARREGGRPTTANCRSSNFSFSQLCIFHTTLCSIFRSALQSIFGPIYSAFSAVAHQEISPRGLNSLQLSPLAHLLLRQN